MHRGAGLSQPTVEIDKPLLTNVFKKLAYLVVCPISFLNKITDAHTADTTD